MVTQKSLITKPRAGVQLNYSHPRTKGLIGYWIMNEGSGSRINDLSSNRKTGLATNFAMSGNTSNWAGSYLGGCLNFDGVNDHIDVSTSTAIIGTTREFSVSAWIRLTDASASPIIYAEGNTGAINPLQIFRVDSTGVLYGQLRGTSSSPLNIPKGTKVVNDGRWHNVIMVVTSSGTVSKFYVDGASDAFSGTNSALGTNNTTNSKIGCLFYLTNPTGAAFFPGNIDEVRLYNRMLTESEAQSLYSAPHADLMFQSFLYNPVVANMSRFFLAS